jgi:hypothetical protein
MATRPSSRGVRSLVRTSQRSRSESELLCRAYALALPMIRRRLADRSSARPRPGVPSFPVPQTLVGG